MLAHMPEDVWEGEPDLVPIDEVARRFGLRASAIRYYEERDLVRPASRQGGRRWYGPDEIRRLAIRPSA
jgi:MerR family transcriptional regulator, copper efflux regulator